MQQDGLGMVNNRIIVDFGMISGLVYVSFWDSKSFKNRFFKLVSKSFCYRFLNRNFDVRDFQIVVFAWTVLQKSIFMEIVFSEFQDILFLMPWEQFF